MQSGSQSSDTHLAGLARLCAAGDRAALRRLYDAQAPRLKGLALRMTGNAILAEDVVHDVFVRFWQNAAHYDPQRGTVAAWLTTMTRSRALDMRRRRNREVAAPDRESWHDTTPDALASLAARMEAQALHHCLNALDDAPRRLIMLAFLQGHTHAELAARLDLPLGTVKSSIRRGLAVLRACLELAGVAE